jgi:23S rRNA (uracil1939-C5)-methyltransferase
MTYTIEKLVFGGLGLCRTGGGIVLVEAVLPGERVEAHVYTRQGGVPVARIQTILTPSAHRVTPPCPYAGACGGCDWLHIAYEEQVRIKQAIFSECLTRIGKLAAHPAIETFASPPWAYRQRVQLKIDTPRSWLGFFSRNTNNVVGIERCPLLVDSLNNLLLRRADVLARIDPLLGEIKAIAGDNNHIASAPVVEGMTAATTRITIDTVYFTVGGSGFFQGNRHLLNAMSAWARPLVSGDFFIDMFGGVGYFSLLLGQRFAAGLLVEAERSLVKEARENFLANSHTLILDPPRPGLTSAVREGIAAMKPATLLYVSCNPSTQARDVLFLTKECGYTIERAALFDLYPQTHHLETAILMRR